MFFLFYKFLFLLKDFLEIQRKSFYLFLNLQLGEELSKMQPLLNLRKFPIRLHSKFHLLALTKEQNNLQKSKFFFANSINDLMLFNGKKFTKTHQGLTDQLSENLFTKNSKEKKKNWVKSDLNETIFPIFLYFLYKNYKFLSPRLTIEESIILSKTYCCHFYVPVQLIDSATNYVEIQWIFLGSLPLLTRRGHFIINGTPRIVLNQIVRSPGIYFHKEAMKSSRYFYAEIISNRGPWIRVEIDHKKQIWVVFQQSGIIRLSLKSFFQNFFQKFIDHQFFLLEKKNIFNFNAINNIFWKYNFKNIKKKKKKATSVKIKKTKKKNFVFLKNNFNLDTKLNFNKFIDFSQKYIKKLQKNFQTLTFNYHIRFFVLFSKQNYNCFSIKKYAMKNTKLFYFPLYLQKNLQKLNKFNFPYNIYKQNFEISSNFLFASSIRTTDLNFYLNFNDRIRLNQRLGLSLKTLNLTPIDFLAISDILFQFTQNKENISLDDIDNLKNRKLKTLGELLQNQFTRGVQRFQKTFEKNLKKNFIKIFNFHKYKSHTSLLSSFKLDKLEWKKKKLIHAINKQKDETSNISNALKNKQNTYNFEKRNSYLYKLQKIKYLKNINYQFKRNFVWDILININHNISSKIKQKRTLVKISKTKVIESLINTQAINSTLKEFFHSHQLSQYLDQSNPLAEITHKRRLSCLGTGGVNRDTAGMEIRGIHLSHYGRICPIETPEGKNAGLVNSLTTAVRINAHGYLKTPFIEIYKKHKQNQKKLMFFSAKEQETKNVFFSQNIPQLKNISVGILNLQTNNFQKCQLNLINLITFNPQQCISIATTCIPFVEHDDANRALMGSNMQRQALPLLKLEQPIVTTVNAFRVLADLNDIPTSFHSGIILYASQQKIILFSIKKINYNVSYT